MTEPHTCCSRRRWIGVLIVVASAAISMVIWALVPNPSPPRPTVRGAGGNSGQPGTRPVAAVEPADAEPVWETEQLNLAAGKQLHLLVDDLEQDGRIDPAVVAKLADASFRGDRLRPETLVISYKAGGLTVARARLGAEGNSASEAFEGVEGLSKALAELVADYDGAEDIHVHFKITSVELKGNLATTRVLLEAGSRRGEQFLQQRAWWKCRWRLESKQPPRLTELRLESLEEVRGKAPRGRLFADATAAVLAPAPEVARQLARGIDYWRRRMQAESGVALHGHNGLAIGDVNGDGLEDLYLCQPGGMPNRLLVQQPDGSVRDTAAAAGVDWLDRSRSALFVDLDNDGDQDLVVVLNVNIILMSNDGQGRFTERDVAFSTGDPYSLSAADFDGDGDLDLYVTGYGEGFLANEQGEGVLGEAIPYPYHDANNGGPNLLLRNDGDWGFTDATEQVGLGEHNRRWSFAAGWADYDADGDPDLYVANDYGRNCLYRNDGGHFHDVAAKAGVEDIAAGMSVSWCDYNGDGRPDLYVGNMFSSAGERIAYQRRFQEGATAEIRGQFQRHARGNTLFENVGDGTFKDVSTGRDVTMGRWAWGSPFVDINNDGRPDVVVANGYITGSNPKDL